MIIGTYYAKQYHNKEENVVGTVMPVDQDVWLYEDWDKVYQMWDAYISIHTDLDIEEFIRIWNDDNDNFLAMLSIDFYQPD
jgi:hypothetical protein